MAEFGETMLQREVPGYSLLSPLPPLVLLPLQLPLQNYSVIVSDDEDFQMDFFLFFFFFALAK